MLKKGVIVDNAPPNELLRKIEGKVWNVSCTEEEIISIQERYRVTNICRYESNGMIMLRILADDHLFDNASVAVPTLEDYYLHVFGEGIA